MQGVGVRAGGRWILSEVELTLRPGELVGLIGPSGAGKSTMMGAMLGLRTPSAGKVSLGGEAPRAGGAIGFVPQDDVLHRALRVRDALGFGAELRLSHLSPGRRAARIREVAERLGLHERMDVRVRRLSGGQRKRVSVALELLTAPSVLVLDEPTSGLDPGLEAQLMGLFAELAREGRIVLVATHAMRSLHLCDRVLVLVDGRLVYAAAPEHAPGWFEASDLPGIFDALPKHAPLVWARKWQQQGHAVARVAAATSAGPNPAVAPSPPASPAGPADAGPKAPSSSAAAKLAMLKAAHKRGSSDG